MDGYLEVANIFKALAHPSRLLILEVLEEEGEACVCHMEKRLNQRQAYISQHLAKLREVGLVVDRKVGLNVFYAITVRGIDSFLDHAKDLVIKTVVAEGLDVTFPAIDRVPPEQCNCPKCEEKVGLVVKES